LDSQVEAGKTSPSIWVLTYKNDWYFLINNDFKRYTFPDESRFDLGKHVPFGETFKLLIGTVRGQGGGNGWWCC
jgi:hypothetical protein